MITPLLQGDGRLPQEPVNDVGEKIGEYVTDSITKKREDNDNYNGNEYENQNVFYNTLTFFAWAK
jgi:hypothetical protein